MKFQNWEWLDRTALSGIAWATLLGTGVAVAMLADGFYGACRQMGSQGGAYQGNVTGDDGVVYERVGPKGRAEMLARDDFAFML